jgi:thiamine kinase-like enzyme
MTSRDSILRVSRGLPETLIHGDAQPENVGIRLSKPQETLVLIDWELAGPGMPAWELVHHLWNLPLRPATNEPGLLDCYYQRYCLHGGTAMDRTVWEHSINVALVQYGVALMPLFVGMALLNGDRTQIAVASGMADSVRQAFAAIGL